MTKTTSIVGAGLVPGQPHLLLRDKNPGYTQLADAMSALGDRFARLGIERIFYYSTQWLSVLGHSVQARRNLNGYHVDDNWHELPDLPFSFRVDDCFAHKLVTEMRAAGYQARSVDYEGFPVDTGTIVADRLINRGRFSVGMLSCCVYSDYADTRRLAATLARVVEADATPTGLVCVSGLSGRWFTREIDLQEDHIAQSDDDHGNRFLIDVIERGKTDAMLAYLPDYSHKVKADMGMKALAVLQGMGILVPERPATCDAYGAIYGTGAAVITW